MQQPLLSIVIPVYNEEQYLCRCLESVIGQTYKNLEIIILNDGSTDKTGEICTIYARQDKRIRYFEQNNHGVAYTKKRGIELAKGQYIGFVDADDYIDKCMYENLFSHLKNVQLVTAGFFYGEQTCYDLFHAGVYDTPKQMQYICENMIMFENTNQRGITTNLNNKLFLTEIIREVVSTTSMDVFIGEDAEIVYKYILRCDAVCVTKCCDYHYERNEMSITQSVNQNYIKNIDSLYFSLKQDFSESKFSAMLIPKLEEWTWQLLQATPQFMGWRTVHESNFTYISPYMNLLNNKKIILYGAGKVGTNYYELYEKTREVEIVLWVDKNWQKCSQKRRDIKPIEEIVHVEYDYILIAIKNMKKQQEIRADLIQLGIPDYKILWKEPIKIG